MDAEKAVSRMFWLAYQSSRPMGMGHLHFSTDKTEADVWADVLAQSKHGHPDTWHGDYVFGRMVKLNVRVIDGRIAPAPHPVNPEYQSWAGAYPTADALRDAAVASIETESK